MNRDLAFAVLASMLIGLAIGAVAARSLCGDRHATPAAAPLVLMRSA